MRQYQTDLIPRKGGLRYRFLENGRKVREVLNHAGVFPRLDDCSVAHRQGFDLAVEPTETEDIFIHQVLLLVILKFRHYSYICCILQAHRQSFRHSEPQFVIATNTRREEFCEGGDGEPCASDIFAGIGGWRLTSEIPQGASFIDCQNRCMANEPNPN